MEPRAVVVSLKGVIGMGSAEWTFCRARAPRTSAGAVRRECDHAHAAAVPWRADSRVPCARFATRHADGLPAWTASLGPGDPRALAFDLRQARMMPFDGNAWRPTRRSALRAAVLLAALPVARRLPAAADRLLDGRYEFAVALGRSAIGRQSLLTRWDGDTLVLLHRRTLRVSILGFQVYDEQHESEERWRNGQLLRLRSNGVESGRQQTVEGDAGGAGFELRYRVEGEPPGERLLPADVGTSDSFWTTSALQRAELVDSTDGDRLTATFRLLGDERLDDVPTRRFALAAGETEAEVWFAEGVMWRALFRHQGHEVDYRRERQAVANG